MLFREIGVKGSFIKLLIFILISFNAYASPLSEVDSSLEKLFDTEKVEPVKNSEEILDFNEVCHKKLEQHLSKIGDDKKEHLSSCLKSLSPELAIDKLTAALNQDQLARFLAREQVPLYAGFLKNCHDKMSDFHLDVQKFTLAAYDISFKNKVMPQSLSTPKGYSPTTFYGNSPDSCYNSGFKAAMFSPNKDSDHVIFAIAGTEADPTYSDGSKRETHTVMRKNFFGNLKKVKLSSKKIDKEDWSTSNGGATGRKQAQTICAQRLVDDAVKLAKEKGKKIIFTGHSLGGALSQGLSYRVKKSLEEQGVSREVQSVNFMPAPGYNTVNQADHDEDIANKLMAINYVSPGDIVSTEQDNFIARSGPHLGEIRYMARKKKLEFEYVHNGKGLDPHTLDKKCFGPLGCSEHILGQEISRRNSSYYSDLNKQRKEIELMKALEAEKAAKESPKDNS